MQRTQLRTLPALKGALLFGVGITLAFWMSIPISVLLPFLAFAFIMSVVTLRRQRLNSLLVSVLTIATGWLAFSSTISNDFAPRLCTLVCRISETPLIRSGELTAPAEALYTSAQDGTNYSLLGNVWLTAKADTSLRAGDVVKLSGVLQPFPPRRNPGDFDLKRFRESNGFIGLFRKIPSGNVAVLEHRPTWRDNFRTAIEERCDVLAGTDAPLWKALLVGQRRDLSPDLLREMRQTGTTHLLALSGMNVSFLALTLLGFTSTLTKRRTIRQLIAVLLLLIYLMIIPDRGSTLRAGIIAIVFFAGAAFWLWSPNLNLLGVAALFDLAYRPGDLFDPGFQLSFAAAIGLILASPIITRSTTGIMHRNRYFRWGTIWIVRPFLFTTVAFAATLPLTAYYFSAIPVASPLTNLIAIPIFELIYAGSWLSVMLSSVSMALAQLLADGTVVLTLFWAWATELAARNLPLWNCFLAPWAGSGLGAALVWMLLSQRSFRFRLSISALTSSVLLLLGSLPTPTTGVEAQFLDVGHGDSALIRSASGSTIVVDGGPEETRGGEPAITRCLHRRNLTTIDLLTASHLESDHIGGLIDVVDNFAVHKAVWGGQPADTKTSDWLKRVSQKKGVDWRRGEAEEQFIIDDLSVVVVHPPKERAALSSNDASLVLRIAIQSDSIPSHRMLLTGDIGFAAENILSAHQDLRSGLTKIPHHGSAYSSSPAFVSAVGPGYVVASRGGAGEGIHESDPTSVFDRYRDMGAAVSRTDEEGAVLFRLSDLGWGKVDWRKPSFLDWLLGR